MPRKLTNIADTADIKKDRMVVPRFALVLVLGPFIVG
jgi:hypothetical protein